MTVICNKADSCAHGGDHDKCSFCAYNENRTNHYVAISKDTRKIKRIAAIIKDLRDAGVPIHKLSVVYKIELILNE